MEQQLGKNISTEGELLKEIQLLRSDITSLNAEMVKLNKNFGTSLLRSEQSVPQPETSVSSFKKTSKFKFRHQWLIGVLYLIGILIGIFFLVMHGKK